MFEVKKILFSTDLSKSSEEYFKYAAYLSQKTGAEIHILHVVEKLSNDTKMALESYLIDSSQRAEIKNSRKVHAREKLQRMQDKFWENVLPEELVVRDKIKSVKVIESYPTEAILKQSRDLEVDLIVMGTHEKGFVETFLGSVARDVLARSRIPVLIVPLKHK